MPTVANKSIEGIIWKILSVTCFTGINVLVRYLSGGSSWVPETTLPALSIICIENFLGTIFLLPFIYKYLHKAVFLQQNRTLHVLRILVSTTAICLWYLSLKYMSIVEVVTLSFLGPLFTISSAMFFMNERLTLSKFIAICLGLFGAYLIAKPDFQLEGSGISLAWHTMLPICSSCLFALVKVMTRKLALEGESPEVLSLTLVVFISPVAGIAAKAQSQFMLPQMEHIPYLLALGCLTASAYFCYSQAYTKTEILKLIPVGLLKFILSIIAGFIVFHEFPDSPNSWVGIVMIAISVWIVYRNDLRLDSLPKPFVKQPDQKTASVELNVK